MSKPKRTPAIVRKVELKLPAKPIKGGETVVPDDELRALILAAKGQTK